MVRTSRSILLLASVLALPVQAPVKGDWAFLATLTEPTPAYLAIPGLLLVTFGGLILAARQVRKLEINYGAE